MQIHSRWVATSENRSASVAVKRVADCACSDKTRRAVNPLFLHGPPGTGKTLLISTLVAEVTDDKSLPKAERKRLQIETAASKSPRGRLLKIADKTSNVRALASSPPDGWEVARVIEYVDWAENVVARCRGVNQSLDRAFDAAVTDARAAIAIRAA